MNKRLCSHILLLNGVINNEDGWPRTGKPHKHWYTQSWSSVSWLK